MEFTAWLETDGEYDATATCKLIEKAIAIGLVAVKESDGFSSVEKDIVRDLLSNSLMVERDGEV